LPDRDTDGQLLDRAGHGDQSAFLELYERHREPIFRFAYRLLGSVDLAEDVTHDCFLSLIKKSENFDPARANLRTYLFAAVRNQALKHFRKIGREEGLDNADLVSAPAREEPLRQLLDHELSEKVREAVANLPPLQREALVLFEFEGLTLNEVADVVGADVGAVKARLYRARERLKTTLKHYLNTNQELATFEEA
jgi:RNA polymerase sigma-70 factor (ECF subfamily)